MKTILVAAGGAFLLAFSAAPWATPPAPTAQEKDAAKQARKAKARAPPATGAEHARPNNPDSELTRREAQNQMPKPGQANDHSTTARDPQKTSGRR